jgi:hypothetical protein
VVRRIQVPHKILAKPFTAVEARRRGVGRGSLQGPQFRRLFRGVYVVAGVQTTLPVLVEAALLVLPTDAVASHSTAMRLRGIRPRRPVPLEFSTNSGSASTIPGIVVHRRRGRLTSYDFDGLPVTGPDRTFVDCAHRRPLPEVIQLGDHLLHTGQTDLATLTAYVTDRHLHGVKRARRLLRHVRERVESPAETLVRLLLVWSYLPAPECNVDIVDADGRFVARGDLVLVRWRIVVEYDGWYHERDGPQRQRDILRRERLESLGWRVIVVTAEDLKLPESIPWRLHAALIQAGYKGGPPRTSIMWRTWFGHQI